jgi:hypothetical protein
MRWGASVGKGQYLGKGTKISTSSRGYTYEYNASLAETYVESVLSMVFTMVMRRAMLAAQALED